MTPLQKTTVSMLSGLTIQKEELQQLKKVFNKLDVNGNGRLQVSDLKNGLNINVGINDDLSDVDHAYQYYDILQKCDIDGDGTLDFNEFIQAAVS